MTPRVATVLSAREWEARLVATARASATVRLVLRAFLPSEVSERIGELDVVVVGSETPWATPARLASWKRMGVRVIGVHPAGDQPAASRLRAGHSDLVLSDDLPAEAMLREIRLLEPSASRPAPVSRLFAVTGGRGAPGRTEIAIGLAWVIAGSEPTVVVDADLQAPAMAIRLGVPPRPDLADAVDRVHTDGIVPADCLRSIGRLGVIPGAHRPGEPPLRPEPVFDVIDAARSRGCVVADVGAWPDGAEIVKAATDAVLVVDGSPLGIVRAAGVAAEWMGPPPMVVVNRVRRANREDVTTAVRRWTGLDPTALIPPHRGITAASRSGGAPARKLISALGPLLERAT
jgi:MinD-like ATPase involved in chromosome partitioning or flagellar assembly